MAEELLFVGEERVARVGQASWLEQTVCLDAVDAVGGALAQDLLGCHLDVELGGEQLVVILGQDFRAFGFRFAWCVRVTSLRDVGKENEMFC